MRVNTVNQNRIEVILNNDEVNDIFGGYEQIDYNTPECRAKIHSLFAISVPDILLPINCKQVFIEVKPIKSGCIISFTKSQNIKTLNKKEYITLIFENSDNLISSLSALKTIETQKSELYTKGEKYAIIAAVKNPSAIERIHLEEYCNIYDDRIAVFKIREYWDAVCKKGAIPRLINSFLK